MVQEVVVIRPIRECDVDSCRKIALQNYDVHFANRFTREVSNVFCDMEENPIYYVADVDGDVVGFAGMNQSWIKEGVWDFTNVCVRKDFRGEGIGAKLVRHRIDEVKLCGGTRIHMMTRIPEFFEQFGFEIRERDGEWRLMTMQLGNM